MWTVNTDLTAATRQDDRPLVGGAGERKYGLAVGEGMAERESETGER